MKELSLEEAKKRLTSASAALYANVISEYDKVKSAYESHSGIILKKLNDACYWWFICDLGNSDMIELIKESRAAFGYNIGQELLYFVGEIPDNYKAESEDCTQLFFARIGEACDNDCDIRILSENDRSQVEILTKVPDDDSDRAKNIAGDIQRDFDNAGKIEKYDIYLLGIFDCAALVGAVSLLADKLGTSIYVANIFVTRDYRGRNYATRLLRTATAMYPGVAYSYECAPNNFASIATAKSAGYILAGAYIFR